MLNQPYVFHLFYLRTIYNFNTPVEKRCIIMGEERYSREKMRSRRLSSHDCINVDGWRGRG